MSMSQASAPKQSSTGGRSRPTSVSMSKPSTAGSISRPSAAASISMSSEAEVASISGPPGAEGVYRARPISISIPKQSSTEGAPRPSSVSRSKPSTAGSMFGVSRPSNARSTPEGVSSDTDISEQDSDTVCHLYNFLYEIIDRLPSVSTDDEAVRIIKDILGGIVRRATKPKPIRKKKPPSMKSEWMKLDHVLEGFRIDDEMFKKLVFSENLLVSAFEHDPYCPNPVGALSLDIQPARGGPFKFQQKKSKSEFLCPKFLVHLSSRLEFMEHEGGSSITAWVDRDLQTLEERRREFLKLDDGIDQQILYVNSQEEFYYLRHDETTDIIYTPQKARNLICEGSNFILMRYLAISKFMGRFETTTVYIDGSLCRNIYESKGPSGGLVNGKKLDVIKIYRTILEKCGIEHKIITLLTLNGEMIKQEWRFSNYILQINPLCEFTGKPGAYRIPLEEKPYTQDLQLLSLYLDSKVKSKKLIANYMEDHPEIKNLLADFVQTILQLKPEDVYEFTAKYFLALTPQLLPKTEYFEGGFIIDEDETYDYDFWKYI